MKRIFSTLILLIFMLSAVTACGAEETGDEAVLDSAEKNPLVIELQIGNPKMKVNGEEAAIDDSNTCPVIENGRTLLPVRAVVEKMGGDVSWNEQTRTVTLSRGESVIRLTIDSLTALLNGEEKTLDTAPKIIGGRTMLPIRFIADGFGFETEWIADSQTVRLTERAAADEPTSGKKTLVVYFSATGSTKTAAEYIAKAADADLFEIEPAEKYTSDDLDWTDSASRVSKEHDDESLRDAELKTEAVPDWDRYDTVFIGYPIWWGIAAWPASSFVSKNDFNGKTVIPFCTSASSVLGESGSLLEKAANGGTWLEGKRFSSSPSEQTVSDWVKSVSADSK